MEYVIGIDVGTESVRGALVDKEGRIRKMCTKNIKIWNPRPDFYQQSSTEIWSACCNVIKKLVENLNPGSIKGLGFDATCSLAVCDADGNPLSVDLTNYDDNQNVILWMDHRAKEESIIINEAKHPILQYVGGKTSVELTMPKILWLKRNNYRCWQKAANFFLLPDFLTWRATGEDSRSLSSVLCACNYKFSPDNQAMGDCGWMKSFFDGIGLEELCENNWAKIGSKIIRAGELCGKLNAKSALETGLHIGTPVAAALIDAHAGCLGLLGCSRVHAFGSVASLTSRLAMICGSSTCHMCLIGEERFVHGVWGPYFGAILPDSWLMIGGQSVSGKLIDHIINTHPATKCICEKDPRVRITEYLNDILVKRAEDSGLSCFDQLTEHVHIYPDFHGNRSPLADPASRGMILGLTVECDEVNLALLYLATIQALAYGTKHILEKLQCGRRLEDEEIKCFLICGGLSKNSVFVQSHANALGLPVFVPEETESVLLGSAILGASVAGFYPNLESAMFGMAGPANMVETNHHVERFHRQKYDAYCELAKSQMKIRKFME